MATVSSKFLLMTVLLTVAARIWPGAREPSWVVRVTSSLMVVLSVYPMGLNKEICGVNLSLAFNVWYQVLGETMLLFNYLLGWCCNNFAPLSGSKCPVSIVKCLFSSTKLGFVFIVSFKKGRFGERQVLTVADRLWIWHLRNMRLDDCSVIKDDLSMKSINDCDVTRFASAATDVRHKMLRWATTMEHRGSRCTLNSYPYDPYCCSKYDRLKW